jgi:hypothetical protein
MLLVRVWRAERLGCIRPSPVRRAATEKVHRDYSEAALQDIGYCKQGLDIESFMLRFAEGDPPSEGC